jgi:hypothetical protein
MCALFIGSNTKPTPGNIEKLRPVLVSKGIFTTLINFLVQDNYWYSSAGVTFSQDNLNILFAQPYQENICLSLKLWRYCMCII